MDLIYFAIVVSVLIFVHELGHFVWAKAFRVKVLTFSVGFGPKVLRLRGRETEYCIGLFPIGGYVKMLEENRKVPVLPEDRERTFEAQSLWRRAIIILAGPVMSILFGVVLYVAVFVGQTNFSPPTIGVVLPHHAAEGRLIPGDRVLEIDGVRITTFAELSRTVSKSPSTELRFLVFRNNQHVEVDITPDEHRDERQLGIVDRVGSIGVGPHRPAAVIGIRSESTPAFAAGLRSFDRITEVRGQPVTSFDDLEKSIAENRGETVPVTFLRAQKVSNALGRGGDLYVYESGLVALAPDTADGGIRERTGMERADLYLVAVDEGSVEFNAGLRAGDRIVGVDDVEMHSWSMFEEAMKRDPARRHQVSWVRNGKKMDVQFALGQRQVAGGLSEGVMEPVLHCRNWLPKVREKSVGSPSLFRYALPSAFDEAFNVMRFIVVGTVKIARGELGLSTIGGPISVYDIVLQERQKGANYLLWAMAIITINLGLLNILPIPGLDGGQLLFLLFEAIGRRPLPLRVREVATLFGFLALVGLGTVAIKNDVMKRWDVIEAQFKELID